MWHKHYFFIILVPAPVLAPGCKSLAFRRDFSHFLRDFIPFYSHEPKEFCYFCSSFKKICL
nr:MAG TPA: hypothetical protein [Caudoviricetes sp.]